jgi:hypothetical protein
LKAPGAVQPDTTATAIQQAANLVARLRLTNKKNAPKGRDAARSARKQAVNHHG